MAALAVTALLCCGCVTARGVATASWIRSAAEGPDVGLVQTVGVRLVAAPRDPSRQCGFAVTFDLAAGLGWRSGRPFAHYGVLHYGWEVYPSLGAAARYRCGGLAIGLGVEGSPATLGDYWPGGDVIGGVASRLATPVELSAAIDRATRLGLRLAYERHQMWGVHGPSGGQDAVLAGVVLEWGRPPR